MLSKRGEKRSNHIQAMLFYSLTCMGIFVITQNGNMVN